MKRDPELIRSILLEFEADHFNHFEAPLAVRGVLMKGTESEKGRANHLKAEHLRWMLDDNLLGVVPGSTTYIRVTAKGCDLIDAIRDEGIWAKTKAKVAETGGNAALEVIKAISLGILRKQLKDRADIEI